MADKKRDVGMIRLVGPVLEKAREQAASQDASLNFVVNTILSDHYKTEKPKKWITRNYRRS